MARRSLQRDSRFLRMPNPITSTQVQSVEPVLLRFAIRAVGNRDVARDLVQETMMEALASRSPFDGRSTLRTWLIGILAHKVNDYFRKARRYPSVDASDDELLATPSPHNVERVVAARQDLRAVERALALLTEHERLAVLLTDVEGIEREAVCRALGVPSTHLRVLLHRGRNRLRRELERD